MVKVGLFSDVLVILVFDMSVSGDVDGHLRLHRRVFGLFIGARRPSVSKTLKGYYSLTTLRFYVFC